MVTDRWQSTTPRRSKTRQVTVTDALAVTLSHGPWLNGGERSVSWTRVRPWLYATCSLPLHY